MRRVWTFALALLIGSFTTAHAQFRGRFVEVYSNRRAVIEAPRVLRAPVIEYKPDWHLSKKPLTEQLAERIQPAVPLRHGQSAVDNFRANRIIFEDKYGIGSRHAAYKAIRRGNRLRLDIDVDGTATHLFGSKAAEHLDSLQSTALKTAVRALPKSVYVLDITSLSTSTNTSSIALLNSGMPALHGQVSGEDMYALLENNIARPALRELVDAVPTSATIMIPTNAFSRVDNGVLDFEHYITFDSVELIRAFSEAFPDHDFALAGDISLGARNLRSGAKVTRASDVVLISDTSTFDVDDRGIVASVEQTFRDAGIEVVDSANHDSMKSANVVLFVGHKNKHFEDMVKSVASTGVLQGKTVATISCYAPIDPALSSSWMEGHGVTQVISFSSKLDPLAAGLTLKQMARDLKQGIAPTPLIDLLRASASKASQGRSQKAKEFLQTFQKSILRKVSELVRHGNAAPLFVSRATADRRG